MNIERSGVHVVGPTSSRAIVGPQRQHLIPCITHETSGTRRLSAGMVVMPPGTCSQIHYHSESDIVVMCVQGRAATLIGPGLEPHRHGPGEFLYVPAGVLHMAVNLSTTDVLVAIEARTDPHFNKDVVVLSELQATAEEAAAALREELGPERHTGQLPPPRSSSPSSEILDVAKSAFAM